MNPTSPTKPEFNDRNGRTWRLALSIGKLRAIKAVAGVDLGALEDGKVLLQLGADYEALAQTLWILCEGQAASRRVEPEEFAELLDGDTIDAAIAALIEAIVLFTRAAQRGPLRTVIATTLAAHAKTMSAVESWASSQSEKIGQQAVTKTNQLLATLGESSPS